MGNRFSSFSIGNAAYAVGILYIKTVSYANGHARTRTVGFPYANALYLIAYVYAAHALYALGIISYKREILVPLKFFNLGLIGQVVKIKVVCKTLQ